MVVKNIVEKAGSVSKHIELGEVETEKELTSKQLDNVRKSLSDMGFELIDDKRTHIIEQIKTTVIDWVHYQKNAKQKINFSDHLSSKLHKDYSYLSNLFSEVENITIEKYLINQKIERVKELLVYDELTLSEIAAQLEYSSVQYLSNQFKKVTGLTPNHYKNIGKLKRIPLDEV
jgi:YesN/AraC family two-component response regulator